MGWEYRVYRNTHTMISQSGKRTKTIDYSIREIYTSPEGYAATADAPTGDDREELADDFLAMASALTKPVVTWQDGKMAEVEPPIATTDPQTKLDAISALLASPPRKPAGEVFEQMRGIIGG